MSQSWYVEKQCVNIKELQPISLVIIGKLPNIQTGWNRYQCIATILLTSSNAKTIFSYAVIVAMLDESLNPMRVYTAMKETFPKISMVKLYNIHHWMLIFRTDCVFCIAAIYCVLFDLLLDSCSDSNCLDHIGGVTWTLY